MQINIIKSVELDKSVLYESFPVLITVMGVYNDKIEKSSIFERIDRSNAGKK